MASHRVNVSLNLRLRALSVDVLRLLHDFAVLRLHLRDRPHTVTPNFLLLLLDLHGIRSLPVGTLRGSMAVLTTYVTASFAKSFPRGSLPSTFVSFPLAIALVALAITLVAL